MACTNHISSVLTCTFDWYQSVSLWLCIWSLCPMEHSPKTNYIRLRKPWSNEFKRQFWKKECYCKKYWDLNAVPKRLDRSPSRLFQQTGRVSKHIQVSALWYQQRQVSSVCLVARCQLRFVGSNGWWNCWCVGVMCDVRRPEANQWTWKNKLCLRSWATSFRRHFKTPLWEAEVRSLALAC